MDVGKMPPDRPPGKEVFNIEINNDVGSMLSSFDEVC